MENQTAVPADVRRSSNAMKLQFSLLSLLLLTALCAIGAMVYSRLSRNTPLTSAVRNRGVFDGFSRSSPIQTTNHRFQISQADIDITPKWENWADTPPLSPRKALEIADAFAIDWFKNSKDYTPEFESISLAPLDAHAGLWCWVAEYHVLYMTKRKHSFFVVVRMDGKICTSKN